MIISKVIADGDEGSFGDLLCLCVALELNVQGIAQYGLDLAAGCVERIAIFLVITTKYCDGGLADASDCSNGAMDLISLARNRTL